MRPPALPPTACVAQAAIDINPQVSRMDRIFVRFHIDASPCGWRDQYGRIRQSNGLKAITTQHPVKIMNPSHHRRDAGSLHMATWHARFVQHGLRLKPSPRHHQQERRQRNHMQISRQGRAPTADNARPA
jgi:hypothetical protein